jgi:hypothetical protein
MTDMASWQTKPFSKAKLNLATVTLCGFTTSTSQLNLIALLASDYQLVLV